MPVRFAEKIRSVSRRSVWALPSKPPCPRIRWLSVRSPAWPNGGWPRSCDRQIASTRSGSMKKSSASGPSGRDFSQWQIDFPICATSSEWVSRVR